MTERTLLRRLRDENTTFQEVLERLREELAFDYLRRDNLTMEKIAYLLGFSSSSAFSRAFVRWTGQRPSDWREGRPRLGSPGAQDQAAAMPSSRAPAQCPSSTFPCFARHPRAGFARSHSSVDRTQDELPS